MDAQSYVGIALFDQTGSPIGNLSILHTKAIHNTQYILSILGIFAVRAAAELERQRANQQLEKLNQNLQKTLLKRTNQLREQEHFLQTLLDLDAFPLSVFWKDINSVYLGCNQSFLRDANLQSLEDIIGQDDYAMPWGKTEADAYRADDREVIESNQPKLGITETQIQSDGRQIWLETNKMPFHDLDGHVMGVLGVYQDITDRKKSEYELQRISTRLNLAAQSAKIGIWEWDIPTDVLLWNTQMFTLYGLDPTLIEPSYDVWLNCLHSDDIARAHTAIQQALMGQADYNVELRIVQPDGAIRFLQANAIVQRDAEGQPVGMVGVNYDITNLKHTEQRLRQQLETIEAAAEGIAIFQGDRYVLMNPAHAKLFGYDQPDELIGQSWKILYEPKEQRRFEQEILPALMRDQVWQGEAIGRRKDGSTFIEGLSLTVSKDGALICMCRDISENKRAEQQLRDAKEAAELADRAKSNFLALMSHEIRTPINGVLGLAHLLQHSPLNDQQREYLTHLSQSAQSLSQIVNDILDFSKIEADQLSLETIPFQLDEVLGRLKAVLALKASEKHLDFRVEIGATVPRCLVGDPLRLGQVAINLVSNAIKFTDRGRVMIRIEECDRHDTTTRLRFAVSDTGIGLSPDQISILFQPFTQVDPSASRRQGGTGLGLSICQRLVRLMGGEIEVQSELGKGSTFTFELVFEYDESPGRSPGTQLNDPNPHAEHPDRSCLLGPVSLPTKPSSSLSAATHSILHGASILLVEDNDVNQLVARKILEQFGMTVDLAVNGRKAIAQVLNRQYDLILMDIRMPEMDGLEAARRIRRLSQLGHGSVAYLKSVPIIAMTAHAFKSDQQRSLEAGMNDHLCKPINPDILGQILADWLSRRTHREQHAPTPTNPVISGEIMTPPIARSIDPAFPVSGSIAPEIRSLSPDLDVVEGLARVYNDTQLYQDLLKLFAELYEPFAATLQTAFQHQDWAQILHLIHTLKGAAANVSAIAVVTQATQVLHLLRTQTDHATGLQFDSDEVVALLRSLDVALSYINQVLEMMTANLAASETAAAPFASSTPYP
jgi:PAS domain S-box-containing protein